MSITIDLESVPGVAVGIARGPLSIDDAKECALRSWRLVSGPRIRILWDLSDARFTMTSDDVRALADYVRHNSPAGDLRTAFVVSGDLEFGLARMFEGFRQTDRARAGVFRDRAQALDWLTGDRR